MEPQSATFESVWAMIYETQRQLQESKAEHDRLLQESKVEFDRQIKENNRLIKESQAETERLMQENNRILTEKQAENDRLIKELREDVRRVNLELGGIGAGNGMFAEQYFLNCFEMGQREFFGEKFDKIENNLLGGEPDSGYNDEYDIVFFNCKCVCIVEVKYRARQFHIDDTIDKVRTFRENFPAYAGHQIYLALGAMSFDKNVEQDCINKGIAVIKQVGDTIVISDENLKTF